MSKTKQKISKKFTTKATSSQTKAKTTSSSSSKSRGKSKTITPKPVAKKLKTKTATKAKVVAFEIVDQNQRTKAHEIKSKNFTTKSDKSSEVISHGKELTLVPEKGLSTLDPLVSYLTELRKYPVLTKEEEFEVAQRYYETKDPHDAEILIKSNLRFVVKIAAEYSKFGAKMIDLIQEGNIGLLNAVKEFNPYKGARLITYAVWWIRGYIQEYLMKQYSMVKIGTTQNQRKLFYQLQKNKEYLDSINNQPDYQKLSLELGISEDEVRDMAARMSSRDISLDQPVNDDSPSSLLDFQKSQSHEDLDEKIDREVQIDKLKNKIEELRPSLSEKELIILNERILNEEPLTLQEIGDKYKITREAVRQTEARLIKKIKEQIEE